jgi:hypothetical protein
MACKSGEAPALRSIVKKVYLEPAWKLHSLHRGLIDYPPLGYQFVATVPVEEKIFKTAAKINFSYPLHHGIGKMLPLNLARACGGDSGNHCQTILTIALEEQ